MFGIALQTPLILCFKEIIKDYFNEIGPFKLLETRSYILPHNFEEMVKNLEFKRTSWANIKISVFPFFKTTNIFSLFFFFVHST